MSMSHKKDAMLQWNTFLLRSVIQINTNVYLEVQVL